MILPNEAGCGDYDHIEHLGAGVDLPRSYRALVWSDPEVRMVPDGSRMVPISPRLADISTMGPLAHTSGFLQILYTLPLAQRWQKGI